MSVQPPRLPAFGQQLKYFRRLRGISQLQLAFAAGVSARHISFMETGRSKPSQAMVLLMAEALHVPLRERNTLLRAAGFAPRFPAGRLDAPSLAPMWRIIERLLNKHEPYPGLVINRYWEIVSTNQAARRLFAPLLGGSGDTSAMDLFLGSHALRQLVENWAEVAWHTLYRLRREVAEVPGDERMAALLSRAEGYLQQTPVPSTLDIDAPSLTTRLLLNGQRVNTVSTIASFNAARDVTLDELRVELVYPADSEAERFFEQSAKAEPRPGASVS